MTPALTSDDRDQAILALNQTLLECALNGDWAGYAALCCPSLSCIEAETNGQLVEGLDFHRFYFPDEPAVSGSHVTMSRPSVRWIGTEAAVLSYVRLVQRLVDGQPVTQSCCETRIWQSIAGQWKLVHMHRS